MIVKFVFLACAVFFVPRNACAYIDPGSISILIQVVVVAVGGIIIAFRTAIANVFRRLLGLKKNKTDYALRK